jgi:hypothetical protein
MNRFLPDWNRAFAEKISLVTPDERRRAGVLLSVIPAQERRKEFLACAKYVWNTKSFHDQFNRKSVCEYLKYC